MRRNWFLLALTLCILLAGYLAVSLGRVSTRTEDYDLKVEAARRTERCFQAVRELKQARGIAIDYASDINATGMIGPDFSLITTTLGNLESKRTSTNPNMAAVLIDMFGELGLEPGDTVAINCSGSFPSLNIATICAAETMGLEPVLISSFGASTHGANDPDFTYQDMEAHLYDLGLISTKSAYFSIGGNLDIGTEMGAEVKQTIVSRLEGLGYAFIYDEDLIRNVRDRYAFYREGRDVKCFINVGGNDVCFGDSSVMVHAGGGILTELAEKDHSIGLIQLFLADHIPVIHLLNVKTLAADYGLPIDPSPIPAAGSGGVYYSTRYNRPLAAAALLLALLPLGLYVRGVRRARGQTPARRDK